MQLNCQVLRMRQIVCAAVEGGDRAEMVHRKLFITEIMELTREA
jgi:hypothetical protein